MRRIRSVITLLAMICFFLALGEAKPSLLRRRQLQEVAEIEQSESIAYNVSLILAIHYLDNEAALQLETPTGSLIPKFCLAVQEQAAGPQVNAAAEEVNLSISTAGHGTLECIILDSVRRYDTGGQIISPDLFSLELLVQQQVYVVSSLAGGGTTADNSTNSSSTELIASLVENGYNRGRGGRVRFRSLLQGSAQEFASVLDLDVLSTLSPPQQAPTEPPSLSPSITFVPSVSPTLLPTGVATEEEPPPSPGPTYRPFTPFPTTKMPTKFPTPMPTPVPTADVTDNDDFLINHVMTLAPTIVPPTTTSPVAVAPVTLQPIGQRHDATTGAPTTSKPTWPIDPSSDDAPSSTPTTEEEGSIARAEEATKGDGGNGISPLIIAACVGAGVAIITCCCFFFIVFWKKRQKRSGGSNSRRGQDRADANNDGARDGLMVGQEPSSTSEVGEALARRKRHFGSRGSSGNNTNESVATAVPHLVQLDDDNRSLANTTLGEYTAGRKPPKKKRVIAASMDDSFDEESLYTSPSKHTAIIPIQPGRLIDEGDEQPPSSSDLGVKVDYDDALAFASDHSGSGDAWLGDRSASTTSPLAAKIERMIDNELGASEDSEDVVIMGEESPISSMFNNQQSRRRQQQQKSNVVAVPSPEANESDGFALVDEEAAKAAADAAMANDDDDDGSSEADGTLSRSDSRSSITEKIGNLVSTKTANEHQHQQLQEQQQLVMEVDNHEEDFKILSPPIPRKSPDAPGMYLRSESDRFLFSPTIKGPTTSGPPKSRSFSPSFLQQEEKKDEYFVTPASPMKASKPSSQQQAPTPPSRVRSSRSVPPFPVTTPKSTKEESSSKPPMPAAPRSFFTPKRASEPTKKDEAVSRVKADGEKQATSVEPEKELQATGIESEAMEAKRDDAEVEATHAKSRTETEVLKSDEKVDAKATTKAPLEKNSTAGPREDSSTPVSREEEKKEDHPTVVKPRAISTKTRPPSRPPSDESNPNMFRSRPLGSASTQPRTNHFLPIPGDGRNNSRNSSPLNMLEASSASVASTNLVSPTGSERQSEDSVSSASEDEFQNDSFLFDAVAETLGPRSMSADLESLGGRSAKSRNSVRSTKSARSHRSYGSRNGRRTDHHSTAMSVGSSRISYPKEDTSSAASLPTPRTLEHDLQRLESQLREIAAKTETTQNPTDPNTTNNNNNTSIVPPTTTVQSRRSVSPISTTSSGVVAAMDVSNKSVKTRKTHTTPTTSHYRSSTASSSQHTRISNKQRVIVVAPPGKLGVILANRRRGAGTVVSEVRANSALAGSLVPGDKLIAIDGMDVSQMIVKDITAIMQERSNQERHLTVITTTELRSRSAQTVPTMGEGG